jgi:hypothetical protein
MYHRNPDLRLRELARLGRQGDISARDHAIRLMMRSGYISPSVAHLLAMAGYTAVLYGEPPERFSLFFGAQFTHQIGCQYPVA